MTTLDYLYEMSGVASDLDKAAGAAEDYSQPGGPGTAGVNSADKVDESRLKAAAPVPPEEPGAGAKTGPATSSYDPTGDGGKAVHFDSGGGPSAKHEAPGDENPFGINFDADGEPVYPEKVTCPHCGADLPIPKDFKGSRGPCPKCRKMIVFFEK